MGLGPSGAVKVDASGLESVRNSRRRKERVIRKEKNEKNMRCNPRVSAENAVKGSASAAVKPGDCYH